MHLIFNEQVEGRHADNIRIHLFDSSQNHQCRSSLANDFVRKKSPMKKFRILL